MGRVFISYRYDVSSTLACALYQYLHDLKIDVFLNKPSFERTNADPFTLSQIEVCSQFILVLTPGTLKLCAKADDYLRTEIETAIKHSHPITLLTTPKFNTADFKRYLDPETAQRFAREKPIMLRHDYIDETVAQIRKQGLSSDGTPVKSVNDQEVLIEQYFAQQPRVTFKDLDAQRCFEFALATTSPEEAIDHYTKAIAINSVFAQAYYNRGAAYLLADDEGNARVDYQKAVELCPALNHKLYTHRTVNYVKERPPEEEGFSHPALQVVEVPLRLVSLVKQPDDLPSIAAAWINHHGDRWPSDLKPSAILQRVHLMYLPFWVVSCHATAIWKAKVPTSRRYGTVNYQTITGSIECQVQNEWIPNYTGVGTIGCGPRETFASTIPVDLDDLKKVEIAAPRQPLNKVNADMLRVDVVRAVLKPAVAREISSYRVAETTLSGMQYHQVDQYVALYPIYFSQHEYAGDKLQFQIDGVTGAMYGELPAAYKRLS